MAHLATRRAPLASVLLAALAGCGRAPTPPEPLGATTAPLVFAERAKLLGGPEEYRFGSAVAISGGTVAVATPGYTDNGHVQIFARGAGGAFTQQADLSGPDADFGFAFGNAVALSGDTLLVAAARPGYGVTAGGRVYVYLRSGATWSPQATLSASDGFEGDSFGFAIALSGDTALISSSGVPVTRPGAAYVFQRSSAGWAQKSKLTVTGTNPSTDTFGAALGLDGDLAVATLSSSSPTTSGAAYVFTRAPAATGTFTQSAIVRSTDVSPQDNFGRSVAVSKGSFIVGAYGVDPDGAAYVFTGSGATWTQQAKLVPTGAAGGFAYEVAMDGDLALVGASMRGKNGAIDTFRRVGSTWSPGPSITAVTPIGQGSIGDPLGLSGGWVIAGAPDIYLDPKNVGSAYVFQVALGGGDACGAPSECLSGVCSAGKCAECAVDGDCAATAWCSSGSCVAKKAIAAPCTKSVQCTSGSCADGLCCGTTCGNKCEACTMALTGQPDGTCAATLDGLDPRLDCPGTSCATDTLLNNVCNGARACRANSTSCKGYGCRADGAACLTACTTAADCGANAYCDATGKCAPRKARGEACAGDAECVTGASCADGVCCNEPCKGQCEACAEPGSVGTCVPAKGKPRAGRAACAGEGTPCGGKCDGIDATRCGYPGATTTCGGGCVGRAIEACDAKGGCGAPADCPGNRVCADAASCKTTCAGSDECAPGYVCLAGSCAPKTATCSADGTQSIPPDDAGPPEPCAPLRCGTDGQCKKTCATTDDCAAGYACDTSSGAGKCLASAATSDAGGCSTGGGAGGSSAALCALLGLAALGAARRGVVSRRPSSSSRRSPPSCT